MEVVGCSGWCGTPGADGSRVAGRQAAPFIDKAAGCRLGCAARACLRQIPKQEPEAGNTGSKEPAE